jgi:Probable cobalt transporter subunit (CbtA)
LALSELSGKMPPYTEYTINHRQPHLERLEMAAAIDQKSVTAPIAIPVKEVLPWAILGSQRSTGDSFPAVTLWQFRLASFGIQTVLWGSIGVMFGFAAEQTLGRPDSRIRRPAAS